MRRSFGGSNQGMGGGNGGFNDGGLLRSVARAVTRASVGGAGGGGAGCLQEPFSSSPSSNSTKKRVTQKPNSKTHLSLASSVSSSCHTVPVSANSSSFPYIWPHCDEFEWVSVDGSEDSDGDGVYHQGFFDEFVIGSLPSLGEVQTAVSALQHAQLVRDMYGASSDEDVANQISSTNSFRSELDWIEPSMQFCNSRMLQSHGFNRVYDAFHLLQTDKSVQRMVISLSSDKAVWDAVMNNDVVRELKESFDAAGDYYMPISDAGPDKNDAATSFLKWILDSTKAKASEVFETIMKFVNELLKPYETEKPEGTIDPFEEKLRSSFMLTIMVLLIVVVGRSNTA